MESLEYAVEMTEPIKTDLESQIRLWIKKNRKEKLSGSKSWGASMESP